MELVGAVQEWASARKTASPIPLADAVRFYAAHRTDIFAVGIILWEMLAGRRLFQGKTDLETVKKVQRAEVPDLRQFNPNVPESVLRVLSRALAGEPNDRYSSARQLGYDLNQVMFDLPRAVSSFDIAQLVLPIQTEKDRERRASETGSLIGSLIDQALFQFTSLGDENAGGGGPRGASALDVHSFAGLMPTASAAPEPVDWSANLGLGADGGEALELGNLSVLEEAFERPPSSIPEETPGAASQRGAGGGSKWMWLVLLSLALLGGALGYAYKTGQIPPGLLRTVGLK